jgi:hypothetical protein
MNKRFSTSTATLRGCFVFFGVMILAASQAGAIFVGSVDLGSAGPDSYVLLTVNTQTKLTANNESAITGNVGILGGAGKYSTSGDAFIDGTAFLAGPASIDPSRAANIVTNADAQLLQAAMKRSTPPPSRPGWRRPSPRVRRSLEIPRPSIQASDTSPSPAALEPMSSIFKI